MSVMNKSLFVTMPDTSVWAVPVRVIALNRAKYYAESDSEEDVEKSLVEDTVPLFDEAPEEIEDWAENNMNWSDVKQYANKVKEGDVDYQEGWMNGEKSLK